MSTPYFTPDLPGVGGRIKTEPADFEVEEIPAYEPSGAGEHLFLWIEKTDMGAEYFARQVARRLNIPTGEVGTAGLKDRRAVTRQWVSVPTACEANLTQIDGDGIRVLTVSRHSNKLKPGHLKGNRFRILIRDAVPGDVEPIMSRVRELGLPNFYGPQRFGRDGETAALGMAMLKGERTKVRAPFLRKLALSAAQSQLFNAYLARRMADGLFRTVLDGDVLAKWPVGGMFTATDVPTEQRRFDARETVTAGPMFGRKTFPAHGAAAAREVAVLEAAGLTRASFEGFGKLVMGTRRHNLVYVDDLSANWENEGLRLTFTLPAGSYATVLLREVMKADVTGEEGE
ncbi:MAG TPA: tRNA pseudouridine(13) synthase TruD [Gemmataceae bacterium]|jgi:tRNA pseudouridine13 synthase|nr:tRNA pseudouridine(13) synthase TruD [Gemmataceae bacterium]